jgi:hypothetical protein
MLGIQHWLFQELGQRIIFVCNFQVQDVLELALFGFGLGDFFWSPGYVFPAGYSKNQVCVGNLFGIYDLPGFAFDTISTIPASFSNGALIDLGHSGQDDVILVIVHRI